MRACRLRPILACRAAHRERWKSDGEVDDGGEETGGSSGTGDTAVRVTIQRHGSNAAQTPEADAAAQPTAEPTDTAGGTDAAPTTPHKHKKHGGDSDS